MNQHQVDAEGVRVGINRPDIQGTSPADQREYWEIDSSDSARGPEHERRLKANDPESVVHQITQD